MRFFTLFLMALALCLSAPLQGADGKRQTVTDYLQLLPADTFEGPPAQIWSFVKDNKEAIVDVANGYIRCPGDGGQGDFEVVLFRYKDDRPLLAVCQGEPAETDYWYLHFYELGNDGQLHKVDRALLPPGNEPRRRFDLPRKGRMIVVTDTKSGKALSRWTWNGGKFVKEK